MNNPQTHDDGHLVIVCAELGLFGKVAESQKWNVLVRFVLALCAVQHCGKTRQV